MREASVQKSVNLQLVANKKVARPGSFVRLTVSSAIYGLKVQYLTLLTDQNIVYESKIISRADWVNWGAINLKVNGSLCEAPFLGGRLNPMRTPKHILQVTIPTGVTHISTKSKPQVGFQFSASGQYRDWHSHVRVVRGSFAHNLQSSQTVDSRVGPKIRGQWEICECHNL